MSQAPQGGSAVVPGPWQTGGMGNRDDENLWYYCLNDHTVRQGKEARGLDRMGPYPDRESAQNALEIAKARNAAADSDDAKWNN
jgi:hypothetical protein